jgi:hypothetical protein
MCVISDVISFQTPDVAGVVDTECRSVSFVNPGRVLAGANDIKLTDANAVTHNELVNVNAVNKEGIETTATVVTRRASNAAEMKVNCCQQVSSDKQTDASQYESVPAERNFRQL